MKKISLILFFLIISCNNTQTKNPVKYLETVIDNHPKSKIAITQLEQWEPTNSTQKSELLTVLKKYYKAHPTWHTYAVVNKLASLHKFDSKEVETVFFDILKNYPPQDYYPLRDDRVVEFIITNFLEWSQQKPLLKAKLSKIILKLLNHINYPVDPYSKLRLKIAKQAYKFDKDSAKIAYKLLTGSNQHYSVNSEAARSLGKIKFSNPKIISSLIKGLFIIKDGVSMSYYAGFALTSTQNQARNDAKKVLKNIVLYSYDILDNFSICSKVFHQKVYCNLYQKALKEGWTDKDPILFERTAITALSNMREKTLLLELFNQKWSKQALLKKWRTSVKEFLESSGQETSNLKVITFTPTQRINIASYIFDVYAREALLDSLAKFQLAKTNIIKNTDFTGDVDFQLPVMDALSYFPPDPSINEAFIKEIKQGSVWVTASIYYSTLRNTAFKETLENSKFSQQMIKVWNSKNTEKEQWDATRKFWQPALLKKVNNFKYDSKNTNTFITNPNENYRLEVYKLAWMNADINFAKELNQITPESLLTEPEIPQDATADTTFANYPWNENIEKLRKKEALKLITQEMNQTKNLNTIISKCKKNPDCYLKLLKSTDKNFQKALFKTKILRMLGFYATKNILQKLMEIYFKSNSETKAQLLKIIEKIHPAKQNKTIKQMYDKIIKLDRKDKDILNNIKFFEMYKSLPQ